jgi:hypothetical protein
MLNTKNMVVCDCCQSTGLESVYQVRESPRGAEVKVCIHCGLVQIIKFADLISPLTVTNFEK